MTLFHNGSSIKDESNQNALCFVMFCIILVFIWKEIFKRFWFVMYAFQDPPLCKAASAKYVSRASFLCVPKTRNQGVTRRCRLSCLTNSALVYEPKCGGRGWAAGSQPMSAALHRRPNKLWISNFIFNLYKEPFEFRVWRRLLYFFGWLSSFTRTLV